MGHPSTCFGLICLKIMFGTQLVKTFCFQTVRGWTGFQTMDSKLCWRCVQSCQNREDELIKLDPVSFSVRFFFGAMLLGSTVSARGEQGVETLCLLFASFGMSSWAEGWDAQLCDPNWGLLRVWTQFFADVATLHHQIIFVPSSLLRMGHASARYKSMFPHSSWAKNLVGDGAGIYDMIFQRVYETCTPFMLGMGCGNMNKPIFGYAFRELRCKPIDLGSIDDKEQLSKGALLNKLLGDSTDQMSDRTIHPCWVSILSFIDVPLLCSEVQPHFAIDLPHPMLPNKPPIRHSDLVLLRGRQAGFVQLTALSWWIRPLGMRPTEPHLWALRWLQEEVQRETVEDTGRDTRHFSHGFSQVSTSWNLEIERISYVCYCS